MSGQRANFWRLFGTSGPRDTAWLTLAPPPVLLTSALGHADRTSVEENTGVDQVSTPHIDHAVSGLPINILRQ